MEAKGYLVLDADTRKWFIENIAPSMFALRHPRRLGNLAPSEAHALIDECQRIIEEDEGNFDANFKLGVAAWRVGNFYKANASFYKAVQIKPDSLDAVYNAAISSFKIGNKKKAMDLWRKYLSIDRSSFWTLRVQKFLSTTK